MTGAYIHPIIYSALFSSQGKKELVVALQELKKSFHNSGYRKLLVTANVAEEILSLNLISGDFLCVVLTKKDVASGKMEKLASRVGTLCYLAKNIRELPERAVHDRFSEVIVWIQKEIKDGERKVISEYSNIKLLFSYELSQEVIIKILRALPDGNYLSQYLEAWPKSEMSLWYDPKVVVLLEAERKSQEKSIIIPFQNNWHELKCTLLSLKESLVEENNWEIILADDGWEKEFTQEVQVLFPEFEKKLTYLKVERPSQRQRGDGFFRAGVIRNQAAKHAQGDELVFMDSDILIGPNYWEKLRNLRKNHSGPIMPRRRQLTTQAFSENKIHRDFNIGESTQLSWGGHWEHFYRNWENETSLWKWNSTYCLAISKEVFRSTGGFYRGFYCYGFEDTELGYRLAKHGHLLKVLDEDVFHLPLSEGRSEFAGKQEAKRKILYKSFQVFLRATQDQELLTLFQHVISKG